MKINVEMTLDEESKIKPLVEELVEDALRRLRRQFREGDKVVDRYGQILYISHICVDGTFELRDWGSSERVWKEATDSDIRGICLT